MKQIKYNENSLFINASARLPSSSPSSVIYNIISVGLIIDINTGIIEDCTITLLSEGAVDFLRYLITGYNLNENGINPLIKKVKRQYLGESVNSICVSLDRAYNKYIQYKNRKEC